MVKRRKEEEIAGILEFDGKTNLDTDFLEWMAEHKASNGGKLKVSRGAKGVRVAFEKDADMATWKNRADKLVKSR